LANRKVAPVYSRTASERYGRGGYGSP